MAEPEQVVREFYRAVGLRDLGRLRSLLAEDVVWVPGGLTLSAWGPFGGQSTGSPPFSGDAPLDQPFGAELFDLPGGSAEARGCDAVLDQLAAAIRRSEGTYSVRLQQLFVHRPDRVVAFHEMTRSDGAVASECILYEIDEGLVRRVARLDPTPSAVGFAAGP